jgi:6-phosphofructokinase 1
MSCSSLHSLYFFLFLPNILGKDAKSARFHKPNYFSFLNLCFMEKIALLTSGGDAPGMNACIRAIVKTCLDRNIRCFGIYNGYQGLIDKSGKWLTYDDVDNIIQMGGTILGTGRCPEFLQFEKRQKAAKNLTELEMDGLIVIGGDGTFAGAAKLWEEFEFSVIGIPGTIDNDILGTDYTIGFETAINTALDAVDKIRDTASSHHRIFFVEVMGRHAGLLALHTALAAGAESVLIPEVATDTAKLAMEIRFQNQGKRSSIIIVAEGDDGGDAYHIMTSVKPYLAEYELRHAVLGHIQRGGSPVAKDRIVASRMGFHAVELLCSGISGSYIGLNREELVSVRFGTGSEISMRTSDEFLHLIDVLRTKATSGIQQRIV